MMKNTIAIEPSQISTIFKKYLPDPKFLFVFSTDVVMNSWIDWCVTNTDESGTEAVALERFIAWDKFKGQYVAAKEENKTAIPSILRKIFIQDLIQQNAKQKFFKKIINPEFADSATGFTDWMTKILPSLSLWNKLYINRKNSDEQLDEEDEDYQLLYERYSDFLEKNNFFEPAWVIPDFSNSGNKVIIIYPEILEDFADYVDVFEQCQDITLVTLPPKTDDSAPLCYKYSDSRKELRRTILQIRELVESKKATWQDITLNVPDLPTYRPYLERELSAYCVPFVIRAGINLTKNCAGAIFQEITDCYNDNFSYETIKALLLDNYIPWKNEFTELKENLILEGQRMRCICGYTQNNQQIDIWEKALSAIPQDYRELQFYLKLKNDISAICKCNTFEAIHDAWMAFKSTYLESSEFSVDADKIISRCITELNNLISIEKNFCIPMKLCIENPYQFFVNEISGKTYTPQNSTVGISVYPYRLAAAAAFKYQFVIDSSQDNLEVPYKRLSFLNTHKRKFLKLTDEDKIFNASQAFIRLYAKYTPKDFTAFSFAEESFAGYSIAHTFLNLQTDISEPLEQLDSKDFILNEKKWFLKNQKPLVQESPEDFSFSQAQKEQFLQWYNTNRAGTFEPYSVSPSLQKKINEVLVENRKADKITISQSDMKNFFPCPRNWIFSNVLKLQSESLDTSLVQPFDMGNINHEILERYAKNLKEENQELPFVNEHKVLYKEELLKDEIKELALLTIHNPKADFHNSPLTITMLESQIDKIVDGIIVFLREFCSKFGGYKIKGAECWYSSNNPERNFNFVGKIDCLLSSGNDESTDFGWTIIDYKNTDGTIPLAYKTYVNDKNELADFQIPMYVTLIRENEKVQDIHVAAFCAIGNGKTQFTINESDNKKTFESFKPTLAAFEQYAKNFADCVQKSEYPLTTVNTFEDCPSCNFKSICRYNYTVAGRTK